MDKFEGEFYTKDNGEKPAKDFILGLDVKMRAKVLGIIHVLEEKGNQLREPYSKHLEDEIFEIRGKVGTDITRVLSRPRQHGHLKRKDSIRFLVFLDFSLIFIRSG